jgi:hypothetical protein
MKICKMIFKKHYFWDMLRRKSLYLTAIVHDAKKEHFTLLTVPISGIVD